MIVVLAVLAMVGGLVLSRGPLRSGALDMRSGAGTVSRALRLARSRAIAINQPVGVRFDPKEASVQVAGQAAQRLPGGIGLGVTPSTGQGLTILFMPDGSSSGGRVELAGAGRTAHVDVDWLTGRVSVIDAP